MPADEKLSDSLEGWLRSSKPKTIGSLVELFGEKSFAVLFVLLLAVPALPIPTGGVTHVFEVIAKELLMGRQADEETPEAKAAKAKENGKAKATEAEKAPATA